MNFPIHNQRLFDTALRILLIIGLFYWCFEIISPFLMPLLWATLIAIAIKPVHVVFTRWLGGRRVTAAVILTVIMFIVVLGPALLFFRSITQFLLQAKRDFDAGIITLPNPPEFLKSIPVVGSKLSEFLSNLNDNIRKLIEEHQNEVISISKRIISTLLDTGLNLIQLLMALVISGVLLAARNLDEYADKLFNRVIGENGHEYADLIVDTIRSVVKGILGVAVIQSALAGIGLVLAGVPHAPVWALVCLILAIIQIGPGIVMAGALIYLWNSNPGGWTIFWTIYFGFTGIADNLLKPVLLGKNSPVPMIILFIGVIGGFLLSGITGMFTGAIVLSVSYKLFLFWLNNQVVKPPDSQSSL